MLLPIKLTPKNTDSKFTPEIWIFPGQILSMRVVRDPTSDDNPTLICMVGGPMIAVEETPQEISKLVREAAEGPLN